MVWDRERSLVEIERAVATPDRTSIVATEDGVFDETWRRAPHKKLIQAPGMDESCSCNQCPFMWLNPLEGRSLCLRDLEPQGNRTRGDPREGARADRADVEAELSRISRHGLSLGTPGGGR